MKRDEAKQIADHALEELQQALKAGRSETLLRFLDVMSRFHHYSWNNCILIAIQMPEASFVAGFRRWLEFGRHVRKGEKGIGILAPLAYRIAELVGRLEMPTRDRSRRDFAVVCDLLRLGLAKEDIWQLVSASSKFESAGRSYFDLTITNAERRIVLGETTASQSRASI